MEYLSIANSTIMWLAVLPAVILTVWEAIVFFRRAIKDGKKMGLSTKQFKTAIKASVIASIGPSIVVAAGCIALAAVMGSPIAWMRLAYIGSLNFEMMAANFGANAAGVVLGSDDMTAQILATALWVMNLSSIGWIITTILFTHRMDKIVRKVSGGSFAKASATMAAGLTGLYGQMIAQQSAISTASLVALLTSAAVTGAFKLYETKTKQKWCAKWGLLLSILAGFSASIFVAN